MKLGTIRRISKEEMAGAGGEIPKWVDPFLGPLNDFIEKVGQALQNRLTFKDNMLGKVVEREFEDNVELEVNPYPSTRGSLRVVAVYPASTGGALITGFKWIHKDNGNIGVTFTFTGTPTSAVRLQIHLE